MSTATPDRYAVIGHPIAHSKSPWLHGQFARQTGESIEYGSIDAAPASGQDDSAAFIAHADAFRRDGGKGLNVTLPFKVHALAWSTASSARARSAGAANCLRFNGDTIEAENFDGIGLVHDIEKNLGFEVSGARVLLLGAGGAARGALLPLLDRRPASLFIANRSAARAHELAASVKRVNDGIDDQVDGGRFDADKFGAGRFGAGGFDALQGRQFDLVINATSASLSSEPLPLDAAHFAKSGLAYDMLYGKGLTPFLQLARDAGVRRIAEGSGMLVEQAVESFAWWRGVRPDASALIREMRADFDRDRRTP